MLELDQEAGLIPIRRNGLSEHHKSPIVARERPLGLLPRGDRLLGFRELGMELVDVRLEGSCLLTLRRQNQQPEGHDCPESGQREPDRQLVASHGADPAPGMKVFTASRPFCVFCAAESFCC
jgi:hypothetical protein